jgi:DHA1 family multidrug resistance protein-like MFS transporter
MAEFGNVVPAPVLPSFVQQQLSGVPQLHGQPQVSTTVGVILAVAGVSAALASLQVQRWSNRFGYRGVLITATALAGICYAPAFFVHAVWQLIAVRAAVGVCLGAAMPSATAIIGLITPQARRASAYSLTGSASSFGFAFGPLVGGGLGALFGLRAVFLVTSGVLVIVAVVVAATVREPASRLAEEQPAVLSTRDGRSVPGEADGAVASRTVPTAGPQVID